MANISDSWRLKGAHRRKEGLTLAESMTEDVKRFQACNFWIREGWLEMDNQLRTVASAPDDCGCDCGPGCECDCHSRELRQRYLGVLGLLCEASVFAPDDVIEMMERALEDACKADPALTYGRIINRLFIDTKAKI